MGGRVVEYVVEGFESDEEEDGGCSEADSGAG